MWAAEAVSTGNVFSELKADIEMPNVTAGTNFSFDIGAVDPANGRFYFTDRNNKSVMYRHHN